MSRPSADVNWGGTGEDRPGCAKAVARVVLLVAVLLARWSR